MASRTSALGISAALALIAMLAGAADAGVSKDLQKKFRGQIIITTDALPDPGESVKDGVKLFKKLAQKEIKHEVIDGVAAWSFHFMAFMKKKPGTGQLSLDFYTDDKEKLFVANKRLNGVAPNLTLLQGRIDINEDEGLNKGKSYVVKLTASVRGKDVVLATAKVAMR